MIGYNMTQEEKQLLFKDLCARLPHDIKFPYHIDEDSNHRECDCVATVDTINEETVEFTYDENGTIRDWSCSIKEVKPYLRPMSSMTEEEKDEYDRLVMCNASWVVDDWLITNHFDYRGLIPMGLALEAPKDMYEKK